MTNKRLLTVAALASLTIGGLSVASAASAQGYGSDSAATTAEPAADVSGDAGTITLVQDTEADEAEGRQRGGDRRGDRGHGGCNLDDAAAAIGIDEADLRAALDEGQTIAEVAEANGIDVDTVVDSMVEARADRLAEKVDEGRLTQDEADQKLADAEARIADRVNGVEEGADA